MISRFQADLVIVKFLQKVIIWAQNTTAKTHLGFRQQTQKIEFLMIIMLETYMT